MNRIWVLTLFPDFYKPILDTGVVGQSLRGKRGHSFDFKTVYLGDFSPKNFKGVDDAPYGGGQGMVMRADVLKSALLEGVVESGSYGQDWREHLTVICPSPSGEIWNNHLAKSFATEFWGRESTKDIVFIAGRYEGIDQRFIDAYVDREISIGDFVVSNGDLAVSIILDSALRFVPSVLGNTDSAKSESFEDGLLDHPHYTRPAQFEGVKVPSELLTGNHKEIESYRFSERKRITREHRLDLGN